MLGITLFASDNDDRLPFNTDQNGTPNGLTLGLNTRSSWADVYPTRPELGFHILTPTPVRVREGRLIDYRLRLFGVPFRWRTRITVWDPPHRFVDEQIAGPYHTWLHLHEFTEVEGGTVMRDQVRYRLPLHPLGSLALPLVRAQVTRIFRFRSGAIRRLLLATDDAAAGDAPPPPEG